MAYTTIKKPSSYFNTKLYSGDASSSQPQTGVGFQPDWVWLKSRNTTDGHFMIDSVRGATKAIRPYGTNAEVIDTAGLLSFDTDGFTVGNSGPYGASGQNYVAWNWLGANGTASNTDGSISSTVSANTTSGFSIVSYTGNGVADATIGHGLNDTLAMIILKNRTDAENWWVYHKGLSDPSTKAILLNSTNAEFTPGTSAFNPSGFSTSVFSTKNDNASNSNGDNYIAYCFAEKKGFSKFGSYTGNGSTDGTFIYTGFKPAFVITKCTSTSSAFTNWGMFDSKRPGYNQIDKVLGADLSDSENGSTIGTQYMDFLSNGFKCRNNGSPHNISGASYIYMAFAEEPLVGDNPATAR